MAPSNLLVSKQVTLHTQDNNGTENEQTLDESCIIGIRKTAGVDRGDQFDLFYVAVSETAEGKIEEHTTFRSRSILAPPQEVIAHFAQGETTGWAVPAAKLEYKQDTHLHVVISTGSGSKLAQTCFERLVEPYLSALGVQVNSAYTVHETESAETITELTKTIFLPAAQRGVAQSIILLSGDGGLIDLINGLLSSDSPLHPSFVKPCIALIPTGTGNALANSSGVTLDQTLGLSTLFRGGPRSLPIFKVRLSPDSTLLDSYGEPVALSSAARSHLVDADSSQGTSVYGAVVFSYGLHACLVGDSDTPEYRKHGSARFQMAAKDLLFPPDGSSPHEFTGRVSVMRRRKQPTDQRGAWEPIPRDTHAYVLATLVSQLEKGFTISPASEPLDPKLRLVHFGAMAEGGKDMMGVMQAAYAGGKHVEDERVGYEEVEGVKIEFGTNGKEEEDKWRRVCVDGKIFRVGSKGWVTVEMESQRPLDLMWLQR